MSQLFAHTTSQTQPATSVTKRSCRRCNQRKVRCDRAHPCSRCVEAGPGVECVYPESSRRAPRRLRRPPIAELRAHLKELEEEVEELRASSRSTNDARSSTTHGAPFAMRRPTGADLASQSPNYLRVEESSEARLQSSGEHSRYVGDAASVVLRDKIHEFQEACVPLQEEEDTSPSASTTFKSPFVSSRRILETNFNGVADFGADAGRIPLQPMKIIALWQIYKDRVAPLIPILHKPSIDLMVHEACATPKSTPSPASDALMRSICFAAVVSATPEQCVSVTNSDHPATVHEYKLATEQALESANLIGTQDIRVLQAATLYLLCLRAYGEFQAAWAQAAIVVRVAQKLGVHRDGQHLDLKPFDTEMQRRLWWHICILDILCSEDQGTETQVRSEMFDTQFPVNVDSDELSVDMDSPPAPREGFTDITLCILHCEMMANVRWAAKLPHLSSDQSPHLSPTNDEQVEHLSAFADRVEDRYLRRLNLDIPIQWLTAVIARLMLSHAWLVVRLKANSAADKAQEVGSNDEIFHIAVEMIKFANFLQSNESTAQWTWLCKSYKHQHVMAFILSQVCLRPVDLETDHAWEVATDFYNMLLRGNHPADLMLQGPLSRLMERAADSREENNKRKKKKKKLEARNPRRQGANDILPPAQLGVISSAFQRPPTPDICAHNMDSLETSNTRDEAEGCPTGWPGGPHQISRTHSKSPQRSVNWLAGFR
ncbi:fungal-specific transcription factor domain-containing protein [Aspergillus pseudoustus]|uniref:Fungal-specific transcription factor domain-containing protein n=1 Tax=Aspergillus pseudoustus TaxID=1810923 RepID=A0ABR4IEJ9_9EURO